MEDPGFDYEITKDEENIYSLDEGEEMPGYDYPRSPLLYAALEENEDIKRFVVLDLADQKVKDGIKANLRGVEEAENGSIVGDYLIVADTTPTKEWDLGQELLCTYGVASKQNGTTFSCNKRKGLYESLCTLGTPYTMKQREFGKHPKKVGQITKRISDILS